MSTKLAFSIATLIVSVGLLTMAPANAQSSTAPTWQDTLSQHHQLQYQMMKNMTEEMSRMTERMSQGALTPEQSKEIAMRMAFMSTMMRSMSGLAARSAHTHAQLQYQIDRMGKLMDEMTGNSRMAPRAR